MKVPATPPGDFRIEPGDLRVFRELLWRVHRTTGPHALPWNALRHRGPIPGLRFDPHPDPVGDHPDVGVLYAAADPITAIAEVFQTDRRIGRSEGGMALVGWDPARDLTLLDLTTTWPVRNGAAAAMMMIDDKRHTQAWARAIDDRLGADVDGLFHVSSITNRPIVTLFSRTERVPAFPVRTRFHAMLSDVTADAVLDEARRRLGYEVV